MAASRLAAPWLAKGYADRALHTYKRADGSAIYHRMRLEHPQGDAAPEGRKIIRPFKLNGIGYTWGEPDFPDGKPLYNLNLIAGDVRAPVYVCEGEKAADALVTLGAIATTSGSATSDADADWTPLRARDCILWPDNDDAGRAYAGRVAMILEGLDCTLSAVNIDALALPPKGDAWDWVQSNPNATAADLALLPTIRAAVGQEDATRPSPPPLDLLRSMAAPALRPDDVPEVLGRFAEAQSRATGFDVSILIAAGIGAACAMLSDAVRLLVSSRSSWFESARLWLVIIGGPGAGKTPGTKTSMAPVFAQHRELIAEWSATYLTDERKADEPPAMPVLYVNDATTEALADILAANPRGALYCCDELEAWLGQHDAYRGSAGGKDRGEWLRLFDGGPHQVNRVKRGAFFIPNWGVSLLSSTTPAALRKLAPKLPDDGLLQRLLPVLATPKALPDASMMRVETRMSTEAWDRALRRLYAMPACVVRLSPAARDAFDAEQAELHRLTQAFEDSHPALASHIAKRPAMLARLALVFHTLEKEDVAAEVAVDTMTLAISFLRRQERHAQAVYGAMLGAGTGLGLAKDVARSILASRLDRFNRRELTPRCKAFRAADEVTRHAALTLLADCGWIAAESPTLGHGTHWTVDRRVHELFAEHGEAARQRRQLIRERMTGASDAD